MTDAAPVRVLCVSGDSGSGKTTLVRRLLRRLPRPGARIAVVKHTHHAVDWHPSGKDSAELWDAGPAVLAVAGPDQTAMFERLDPAGAPGGPSEARARDGGGADPPDGGRGPAAATRRLVRACRRLPDGIRLVLAEGFREARAPKLWTAAGPPGAGRLPPGVVAVVVPPGQREPWAEADVGAEVFARGEEDAVAARVGGWAVPAAELSRG